MIRVLIAEDMHIIRGALVALLTLEDDMTVVADLDRGDDILAAALRTRPDVALLDIDLPGLDGLTAAAQRHDHLPDPAGIRAVAAGERVMTPNCSPPHSTSAPPR